MDGLASGVSVGAVVNHAQFEPFSRQQLRRTPEPTSGDVGANALKLIQAIVANSLITGRDLDVTG